MRKQRKLKKGLALFLCLVLSVSLLPLAAGPARAEEYNGFNYRIDRSQGIAIIEYYEGDEFDLTIPDELGGYPVTTLGDWCLSPGYLASVTVPARVTNIGKYAFSRTKTRDYCGHQEYAGSGLITAGPMDSGCAIQYGWTDRIPDNAFYWSDLRVVVIPETITEIGENAFAYCPDLERVYYCGTAAQWAQVRVLAGNEAFLDAELHYSYTLGDNFIVKSGTCGEGLTWTLDLYGLLTVSGTGVLDDSPFDGDHTFRSGDFAIRDLVIEEGVTEITYDSFFQCGAMRSVSLPSTLRKMGISAFSGCESLTELVIPYGVTRLDEYVFTGCRALTSVTIPASVVQINRHAFGNCPLTDVYYGSTPEAWSAIDIRMFNTNLTSANIHYTDPFVLTGVTPDKASAQVGETVTWTAESIGGSAVQYCFYVFKNGKVLERGNYGPAGTCSLSILELGTYSVRVYAKDGREAVQQTDGGTVTVADAPLALTGVTVDRSSVEVGDTVTWTAHSSGGKSVRHCFYVFRDGKIAERGTYGTARTFSYTIPGPGTYTVRVYAKDGSSPALQLEGGTVTIKPLKIEMLKADRKTAEVGDTVTWTVQASGGGAVQYCFYVFRDGKIVERGTYSPANTYSHTISDLGTYTVRVYAKDGSAPVQQAEGGNVLSLALELTGVKAERTDGELGVTVTWTAEATGGKAVQYCFYLFKDRVIAVRGTYSPSNTWSYTIQESGTWTVRVYAKDIYGPVQRVEGGRISYSPKT